MGVGVGASLFRDGGASGGSLEPDLLLCNVECRHLFSWNKRNKETSTCDIRVRRFFIFPACCCKINLPKNILDTTSLFEESINNWSAIRN